MRDRELTTLCAEAMRYRISSQPMTQDKHGSAIAAHINEGSVPTWYDPLHDDAQAMALVKAFNVRIVRIYQPRVWRADFPHHPAFAEHPDDLNRAIVECVARRHAGLSGKIFTDSIHDSEITQ